MWNIFTRPAFCENKFSIVSHESHIFNLAQHFLEYSIASNPPTVVFFFCFCEHLTYNILDLSGYINHRSDAECMKDIYL